MGSSLFVVINGVLSSSAVSNVFVCGSLLADDVVGVLLNRVPPPSPAILPNYQRFSVGGRVYPAILPVQGNKVSGRVLLGITHPELDILDMFEDYEYERKIADILLKDDSEKLQANIYVWANKTDPDLYADWDFEDWKVSHMEDFLKMTKEFVEEIKHPDSKT